jgi:hypothetical protein
MKLTADIADKYLTAVVASSGSRVHADILYSIYRDLTR